MFTTYVDYKCRLFCRLDIPINVLGFSTTGRETWDDQGKVSLSVEDCYFELYEQPDFQTAGLIGIDDTGEILNPATLPDTWPPTEPSAKGEASIAGFIDNEPSLRFALVTWDFQHV